LGPGGLLEQVGSEGEATVVWPGGDVFQRSGQTCLAAFVQFWLGPRSRAYRWRSKAADRGEDGAYHRAGDGHLGQLEGDGAGVTDYAGADLDQLQLQAGEGPIGHGFGQVDAAQEGGQIVGQCVQLQPHLVVAEPSARQPRPAKGILALLDVLLGGAALVVEPHHPVWFHRQVGDDEADFGEQLARMPFDLGDHPARLVPRRRLILEVLVEALDLGLRRSPNGISPRDDLRL